MPGPVIDARSVADAGSVVDARPVADAGSIADAWPVIDARAIADARLTAHARSIADARLSCLRPVDCRCRADRRHPVDCRCRAGRRPGGDCPHQDPREELKGVRRRGLLPVGRHHPQAGWEASTGVRPLRLPSRAAEPVWGCLPLGYERSPRRRHRRHAASHHRRHAASRRRRHGRRHLLHRVLRRHRVLRAGQGLAEFPRSAPGR